MSVLNYLETNPTLRKNSVPSQKILVIDDEELITRTLVKALEKTGYEVMVSKRGDDALIMVEEEDFELIISDIRLPGMNGVETVTKIFEIIRNKGNQRVPAIFITGYADEKLEVEAKKLKPQAYILKPFDLDDILDKVKKAIMD